MFQLKEFVDGNEDGILRLFSDLYNEVNPEVDDDAVSDTEDQTNVFALRECMKLEYQMLQDHRVLGDRFSNSVEFLKQTLNLLNSDNNSIE